MPTKKIIVIIFLLPTLLGAMPISVLADTNKNIYAEEQRLELLRQLQDLLNQLLSLQKREVEKISNSKTRQIHETKIPYQSKFYNFNYEAMYFIEGGELANFNKTKVVYKTDEELFRLFNDLVGREVVAKYVKEWRVYNKKTTDVGAFVELMTTTKDGPRNWIIGVNMEGFSSNTRSSFANLFIHEYAHILLYDKEEFRKKFTDNFWTKEDFAHKEKVAKKSDNSKFSLTSEYYENNKKRFISEYATTNPDEDMAETFIYFVTGVRPTTNLVHDQKISTFYNDPDLVKIREQIRNNLKNLDIL